MITKRVSHNFLYFTANIKYFRKIEFLILNALLMQFVEDDFSQLQELLVVRKPLMENGRGK